MNDNSQKALEIVGLIQNCILHSLYQQNILIEPKDLYMYVNNYEENLLSLCKIYTDLTIFGKFPKLRFKNKDHQLLRFVE